MDQNIGISFQVKGYDAVISAFDRIDRALTGLDNKLSNLGGRFGGFAESIGVFRNLGREISGATRQASQEIQTLTGHLVGANSAMQKLHATTAATQGGIGGRAGSQAGLRPGTFMANWWTMYAGATGASNFAKDTLMGRSRAQIVDPLRDLSVIGFNAEQRRASENTGQGFVRQFYSTGNIKDYLGALSEVGSALDVNDPLFKGRGAEQLNQAAQASMLLGGAAQLKGHEASKLLMSAVHAQLFQMPDNIRKSYLETGERSIGDLSQSTAAKIAKTIQTTSIWGTDVQHFLNYSLPSALSKGWNLDEVLGLAGTLRTAGIRGQKAGRGLKSILEGETGKYASVMIAGGDEKEYEKYQALKPAEQKRVRESLIPKINEMMKADKYQFFRDLGSWLDTAESRGIDPVQKLKLSKEWVGQTRLMSKEGTLERWKKAAEESAAANTLDEVKTKLMEQQAGESGYFEARLSNALTAFKQSIGRDSPIGNILESWVDSLNYWTNLNNQGLLDKRTALLEVKDFALHGVVGGFFDSMTSMFADLSKALGVVPESFKPASFEEILSKVSSIPDKLQEGIDAAKGFFDRLDKAIENRIIGFQDAVSAATAKVENIISAGNANVSTMFGTDIPEQVAPTAPQSNTMPSAAAGAPPAQEMPPGWLDGLVQAIGAAMGSGEAPQVAVRVQIGDREVKDIVIETVEEHRMESRANWGGR